MESALDLFRLMMRDKIAPELRGMGFKGSGQSFTLPSNSHWVLLGFQKSTANTPDRVRFTVNVTAADKRAWSEAQGTRGYLPERPNANTFYGNFAWQVRIGQLLPGGDKWWTITARRGWNRIASPSTTSIANEVLEAIRTYAMPAIEDVLAGSDVPGWWESRRPTT